MSFKSFIFDLNGTMINDMDFHIKAWSEVLNEDLGANLSREQVKKEMYGKNSELLIRIFGKDRFTDEEMHELSVGKEKKYQAAYLEHLKLIKGLPNFLEHANKSGIRMAIGSAAIMFNIDFVLDNLKIRHYFSSIVSADDVTISKPDPETFLEAAAKMSLTPKDCLVFEDAPKGVEAALNAGMQTVVITTMHEAHEFADYPNVYCYINDHTDPQLQALF